MAMPKTSAPSDSELGVRKIHTHIKIGCYNKDLELYQTDLINIFFKMHGFIRSFNLYCFQIKIKCQAGVEKIGLAVDKNYHNPHNKLSKKKI